MALATTIASIFILTTRFQTNSMRSPGSINFCKLRKAHILSYVTRIFNFYTMGEISSTRSLVILISLTRIGGSSAMSEVSLLFGSRSEFRTRTERTNAREFPIRVSSLDENFIVVRNAANLSVSRDLRGFHLYATDLCIIADILGFSAYVVDFHVRHLSSGKVDPSFHLIKQEMVAKYGRFMRPRLVRTPSTIMVLRRDGLLTRILNARLSTRIINRIWRVKKSFAPWQRTREVHSRESSKKAGSPGV